MKKDKCKLLINLELVVCKNYKLVKKLGTGAFG
jgi:hypothetical protein